MRTETPPEGTGLNPLLLWSKPMQVTYRGVKYDTNRQAKAPKTRTLVYRGVEYTVEAK